MTNKPTRGEVFSAYDDLNNSIKTGYLLEKLDILKDSYLAQEEELINERLRRKQEYWEQREVIDKLEAENQALNEEVGAIIQAIKDEPELPGPMPDEMLNDIVTAGIEETMRIVVRETKSGILRRTNHD